MVGLCGNTPSSFFKTPKPVFWVGLGDAAWEVAPPLWIVWPQGKAHPFSPVLGVRLFGLRGFKQKHGWRWTVGGHGHSRQITQLRPPESRCHGGCPTGLIPATPRGSRGVGYFFMARMGWELLAFPGLWGWYNGLQGGRCVLGKMHPDRI